MDSYETSLCIKNEVFVYQIPPRPTNRGYRAADWGLDNPSWTGRMRVVAVGKKVSIKFEDKNSSELFAESPVNEFPSPAVEQVLDSSRYFVIRIQNSTGRNAFIGMGFADRGDAFDFNVALQDHFKWAKRETDLEKSGNANKFDPGPKLDLGLKEGQTMKINIQTKKDGSDKKKKVGSIGSIGLLPPPPSAIGSKANPKTVSTFCGDENLLGLDDFAKDKNKVSGENSTDWSDFTGATTAQQSQQKTASNNSWVQF